ncbi:tetratricopeptide repeat protein [Scytonema sp. PRP1]|uniref:tetratricopeptide repeat protein n=1 Tax=Scytonema sp. PRP1 TaxID=3120513 RepID=UPI00300D5C2B
MSLQPDLAKARKASADILLEQQDTLMAIVEHRQVLELAPTDASSYYHLGLALRDRGRIPEAIEALEQARNLYQQQNSTEEIQAVEAVLRELQADE